MNRTLTITATSLALLGGTALAATSAAPAPTAQAARADVTFRGVRLWHFKGSELSAVGSAETVTYDRSAGAGVAETTESTMPGRRGDPRPVHMSAGSAEGRLNGKTLDARDHVVLSREDGTATSNSAHFDGAAHRVSGTEPVTLDNTRFHVTGSAFTMDTETEQIDLLGPVDAHGRVTGEVKR